MDVRVRMLPDQVIRRVAPSELFGFNVPWRDFQIAYFRDGKVRDEVVEWLRPFVGALYRYPGGTPSNWFEWRKAVGPAGQRLPQIADYKRSARVDFGLEEYGAFLRQVGGRALITLPLAGAHGQATPSGREVGVEARLMVHAVRNTSTLGCVDGPKCVVAGWELGNEMDAPPHRWSADEYASRASAVVDAVSEDFPGLLWIAHGRSAPWEPRAADYMVFNETVADALASRVQGIAIHPYYDGVPVQRMLGYVEEYGRAWRARRSDALVYVTEHGRWPAVPLIGRWQDNWYQATGLGGALATADFVLGLIRQPQVAAANWHALSGDGPWQLFRWVRNEDRLVPTPVYWALRALREGFLDDAINLRVQVSRPLERPSAERVSLLGMRSADGLRTSLLGVNRSRYALRIGVDAPLPPRAQTFRVVDGDDLADDNTAESPYKVTMKFETRKDAGSWCVPPRAVFSLSQ